MTKNNHNNPARPGEHDGRRAVFATECSSPIYSTLGAGSPTRRQIRNPWELPVLFRHFAMCSSRQRASGSVCSNHIDVIQNLRSATNQPMKGNGADVSSHTSKTHIRTLSMLSSLIANIYRPKIAFASVCMFSLAKELG